MRHIVNQKFFKITDFKRTLILALDTSKYSHHTVNWSKANLFDAKDKIVLVSIRPLASANLTETVKNKLGGDSTIDITEAVKNKISGKSFDIDDKIDCEKEQNMMDGYVKDLENYNVEYYIGLGDVKKDLLHFVDSFKADVVVVGQGVDQVAMGKHEQLP
ncbi:hypothetical protein HK103_002214, partial [Boothiomyces macroporosus]